MDRPPPPRGRSDHGDVAQPSQRHVQRARDRRSGQREDVNLGPHLAQQLLLSDSEALLLVDDDEAKVRRHDIARQHSMRAKQQLDLTLTKRCDCRLGLLRAAHPRHRLDADRQVPQAVAEGGAMLLSQDRRRREHQHLLARLNHADGGTQRHLSLAEADVAADQAIHRTLLGEIVHHLLNRPRLIVRLGVRKALLNALEQLARLGVRHARHGLPLRIEDEQLAGHLPHRRPCPRLQLQPRLATELRQLRLATVGANVARQLANLLVRQIQAVLTTKRKIEVVTGHATDRARLEALKPTNPVVLMHDDVAGS